MPFLDERFLNTPSFAVEQCRNTTVQMAQLTRRTIFAAIDGIGAYTPKLDEQIRADEDRLDLYEDKLGTYLVKLSSKELSERDSNEISKLLHSIGDFERIGDHAVNMLGRVKGVVGKTAALFRKSAARAGCNAPRSP